jgi:WhiB family transcriptional regulator, redox-sensing transcriptional regulator
MNVESMTATGAYRRLLHGPGRATFAPSIGSEPPEWTLSALCAQVDPEFWFPEKGGSTREAKKVCSVCPVRAECLAYGLHDGYGIFGGLSERDRRRLLHTGWQPGDPLPDIRHDRRGHTGQAA